MLIVLHARYLVREIYFFLSFDVGIRQKICSRILYEVDVYKCIHASECSFLVLLYSHPPPPPPKLIFSQLCDGRSGAGGVLCSLCRSSWSGDVTWI